MSRIKRYTFRNPQTAKKIVVGKFYNWSLYLGISILLVVFIVSIKGPALAPSNPQNNVPIIQIDGKWIIPPYSPFTPGFPLGSDMRGGDIYSQLLLSVRPTLVLVLVAATARIAIGVIFGVISGWFNNWVGKTINIVIKGTLAIPALVLAMAFIRLANGSKDLRIFFIGVIISGWAEIAQFSREETFKIKNQLYIEAARAMGASSFLILKNHILRQILPFVWILFGFEVSATLMLTAELGFLGYFIQENSSGWFESFGIPTTGAIFELGQMLSSTVNNVLEPWGTIIAGSMVFIIILGFNLLGQGLWRKSTRYFLIETTTLMIVKEKIKMKIDENVFYPMIQFFRRKKTVRFLIATIIFLIGIYIGNRFNNNNMLGFKYSGIEVSSTIIPKHDTNENNVSLENSVEFESIVENNIEEEILWSFEIPKDERILSIPIIGVDGSVYIFSHTATLYVFSPSGDLRWKKLLDPMPYEVVDSLGNKSLLAPFVSYDGIIIVTAKNSVYALDIDGSLMWENSLDVEPMGAMCCESFMPGNIILLIDKESNLLSFNIFEGLQWIYEPPLSNLQSSSKPIMDKSGSVYYSSLQDNIPWLIAVGISGDLLWMAEVPGEEAGEPEADYSWLKLDSTESMIFLSGYVYNIIDGKLIDTGLMDFVIDETEHSPSIFINKSSNDSNRYFSGMDGDNYFVSSSVIIKWRKEGNVFQIIDFAFIGFTTAPNFQAPVSAEALDGNTVWLHYQKMTHAPENDILVWINLENESRVSGDLTSKDRVVAIDEGTFYVCRAQKNENQLNCRSFEPESENPDWQYIIKGINSVKFGTLDLINGRMNIFTNSNVFVVVNIEIPQR